MLRFYELCQVSHDTFMHEKNEKNSCEIGKNLAWLSIPVRDENSHFCGQKSVFSMQSNVVLIINFAFV